jgi:hypothetical protein
MVNAQTKKNAKPVKKVIEQKSIDFNKTSSSSVLKKNRILFIFDASYSMLNNWNSGQKMEVAKKLLGEFVDSLVMDINFILVMVKTAKILG